MYDYIVRLTTSLNLYRINSEYEVAPVYIRLCQNSATSTVHSTGRVYTENNEWLQMKPNRQWSSTKRKTTPQEFVDILAKKKPHTETFEKYDSPLVKDDEKLKKCKASPFLDTNRFSPLASSQCLDDTETNHGSQEECSSYSAGNHDTLMNEYDACLSCGRMVKYILNHLS